MSIDPVDGARAIFIETAAAHQRFAETSLDAVVAAARAISDALRVGRKLLAFGNGGSAADAQHRSARGGARIVRFRVRAVKKALRPPAQAIWRARATASISARRLASSS